MKNSTHIVVLLDRSGSMSSIKKEVIIGINEFFDKQRETEGEAVLSLIQFDSDFSGSKIETIHECISVKDLPKFTSDDFEPRGGTPLLDALGKTIEDTGRALSAIPESNRPNQVVFVVITDGHENTSRLYTKSQINSMISVQEDSYNWAFIYLGANQDAISEGISIGVSNSTSANYAPTNFVRAMAVSSSNVSDYRTTRRRSSLSYSDLQRSALVDDEVNAASTNMTGNHYESKS